MSENSKPWIIEQEALLGLCWWGGVALRDIDEHTGGCCVVEQETPDQKYQLLGRKVLGWLQTTYGTDYRPKAHASPPRKGLPWTPREIEALTYIREADDAHEDPAYLARVFSRTAEEITAILSPPENTLGLFE